MSYSGRPAFRNDWFTVVLILVSAAAAFLVLNGVIARLPPELWHPGALVLAAVALVLAAMLVYRHFQWHFTIDEKTVESSRGIIGRDVHSIRIRDLRNINVRQSLFQRIFGVGDLEFSSAGGDGVEVLFHGIRAPMALKERVQALQ